MAGDGDRAVGADCRRPWPPAHRRRPTRAELVSIAPPQPRCRSTASAGSVEADATAAATHNRAARRPPEPLPSDQARARHALAVAELSTRPARRRREACREAGAAAGPCAGTAADTQRRWTLPTTTAPPRRSMATARGAPARLPSARAHRHAARTRTATTNAPALCRSVPLPPRLWARATAAPRRRVPPSGPPAPLAAGTGPVIGACASRRVFADSSPLAADQSTRRGSSASRIRQEPSLLSTARPRRGARAGAAASMAPKLSAPRTGSPMPGKAVLPVSAPPGAPIHCVTFALSLARSKSLEASMSEPLLEKPPPALPVDEAVLLDVDAGPPPLPVLEALLLLLAGPPPLPVLEALLLLAGPPPCRCCAAGSLRCRCCRRCAADAAAAGCEAPPSPPEPLGCGADAALNWKSSPHLHAAARRRSCSAAAARDAGQPPSETPQRLRCTRRGGTVGAGQAVKTTAPSCSASPPRRRIERARIRAPGLGRQTAVTSSSASAHVPRRTPGRRAVRLRVALRAAMAAKRRPAPAGSRCEVAIALHGELADARGLSTITQRCSDGQSRVSGILVAAREHQTSGAAQSLASAQSSRRPARRLLTVEHEAPTAAEHRRAPATEGSAGRRPEGRRAAGKARGRYAKQHRLAPSYAARGAWDPAGRDSRPAQRTHMSAWARARPTTRAGQPMRARPRASAARSGGIASRVLRGRSSSSPPTRRRATTSMPRAASMPTDRDPRARREAPASSTTSTRLSCAGWRGRGASRAVSRRAQRAAHQRRDDRGRLSPRAATRMTPGGPWSPTAGGGSDRWCLVGDAHRVGRRAAVWTKSRAPPPAGRLAASRLREEARSCRKATAPRGGPGAEVARGAAWRRGRRSASSTGASWGSISISMPRGAVVCRRRTP